MADSEPQVPSVGGPLDGVNDAFHELYDAARSVAEREPPVIVVLADSLVLFRDEQRSELPYTPQRFHVIKSVAHAPVALYSALLPVGEGALDATATSKVERLREHVAQSLAQLEDDGSQGELSADLRLVLEGSLARAERVLALGKSTRAERDELGRMGPTVLRLIDAATRIQLAALHESVKRALAPLSAEERLRLQVVVTGDHQARVRSLGMQYFRKLLREPEESEERVTYAEGVSDETEARALVGTRRLDRALASTFFGDPKRLQRDLLGDAVKDRLAELEIEPIA